MKNPLSFARPGWTCFVLSGLTGAVLASGIVALLVSDKVGAVQLALWQIAAIYAVVVAGCILFSLQGCRKKSDEATADAVVAGSGETRPS